MTLFRAIALILLLALMGACSRVVPRPDPPQVALAGIRIAKLDWREQSFDLTLNLTNPNSYRLPLRGLNYNVKLNGKSFAKGYSDDSVTIAPNESAKVTVRVSSDLLGSWTQLRSMLDGSRSQFDYAIDGSFGVLHESFKLPFNRTGSVNLAPR